MAEATASAPVGAPNVDSAEAQQARRQSNLAYTFMSLDRPQRHAMSVFYDFCRRVDDIADDPGKPAEDKRRELQIWRDDIHAIYHGGGSLTWGAELGPVAREFSVREEDLLAIVDGVAMDIGEPRYETFADLQRYCYGVASAVGLVSVRIFGCTHPRIDEFAVTLGYALQFTNILRDVVEDYRDMGRVYLPQAEMRAFGVREEDFADPSQNENCRRLFRLCHYRCKHFFNKARRLLPAEERENLKAALIMGAIYEDILDTIAARDFRLTGERVRLPKQRKLQLVWRTLRGLKKPLPPRRLPGPALVWGGGIAGIAAAVELGLEGFTPTLLEAKSYLGGRAHSLTDAATGLTLDNGQHIAMGCYTAFLQLLGQLGIEDRFTKQAALRVPYVAPGGQWSELAAKDWPAPFHLLGGLIDFGALSARDRLAILSFGARMRLDARPGESQTAEAWLRELGQTEGALRALWEPFCIAALNEVPRTASAELLYETLRRSLFGSADDSAIYLAKVGLSEVFEPEVELYLQAVGGAVRRQAQIREIETSGEEVVAVLTSKGERLAAQTHISALPWTGLRGLLPSGTAVKNRVASIPSAAILSVHLLTESPLFERPADFVGLLESPVHWVFDRTHTLPEELRGKHLYAVIASAADDWMPLKSNEVIDRLRDELSRFFPAAQNLVIARSLVYKSKDATFAARPATESYRPGVNDAPWDNVWLAGDWIKTGLPATIESAALSARMAVSALNVDPFTTPERAI